MKKLKDILSRYGAALRSARVKAGMTQEEAADRAGVARSKWSYYEHGRKNITLITAERLADAVGGDLSVMVRRPKK